MLTFFADLKKKLVELLLKYSVSQIILYVENNVLEKNKMFVDILF